MASGGYCRPWGNVFAPKLACVNDVRRTFTVATRTFIAMRTLAAAHTWPRDVIVGDSTSHHAAASKPNGDSCAALWRTPLYRITSGCTSWGQNRLLLADATAMWSLTRASAAPSVSDSHKRNVERQLRLTTTTQWQLSLGEPGVTAAVPAVSQSRGAGQNAQHAPPFDQRRVA